LIRRLKGRPPVSDIFGVTGRRSPGVRVADDLVKRQFRPAEFEEDSENQQQEQLG
jgi:hypothetical protein